VTVPLPQLVPVAATETVGEFEIVRQTPLDALHPCELFPTTLKQDVAVGVITIADPVDEVGSQVYVAAPEAVSVVLPPAHTTVLPDIVMAGTGTTLTHFTA